MHSRKFTSTPCIYLQIMISMKKTITLNDAPYKDYSDTSMDKLRIKFSSKYILTGIGLPFILF